MGRTPRRAGHAGLTSGCSRLPLPPGGGHRPFPVQGQQPRTNGICERFHKDSQNERHSLLFRKKLYLSLEELQVDLAYWVEI